MMTDEDLSKAFTPFGNLREAKVIVDRGSGKSMGFGFVAYETVEEAEKARAGMNTKILDGGVIFVDPEKPPPQPPRRTTNTGFARSWTVGWRDYY